MALLPILFFIFAALLIGWIIPTRWRIWVVLTISLLAVYWLQTDLAIRNLAFWLSTVSIVLTLATWAITRPSHRKNDINQKDWRIVLLFIGGFILLIGLTRYFGPLCCLTTYRPPELFRVIIFLVLGGGIALAPVVFPNAKRIFSTLAILLIIAIFIILKSPILLQSASSGLRGLTGQPIELANSQDIIWFGFSFLAFRLLHALFDYRNGKLPAYNLEEFLVYGLFFPTLPAGPIDRSQRFIGDLRQPKGEPAQNRLQGLQRILLGLFKKFFLADSLALIALNSQNAAQVNSTFWMWIVLYAYALRIYFDFAGYTDLAIGLGKFIGINLPENFDRPYLKQNMTAFWNSWHITLAQWFRAYWFNPIVRSMRTRFKAIPAWVVILFAQFTTMMLIGLWHGITWNFAIWGAWHGLGLFIHNRWSDWIRPRLDGRSSQPGVNRALQVGGWFLTFNFVSLGWVWFALPTVSLSLDVFQKLFGI